METNQKIGGLAKASLLSLLLWLLYSTQRLATLNPPEWSTGFMVVVWYTVVFFGIWIAVMMPSGFVMLLTNEMLGTRGSIFCTFWFVFLFDEHMNKHYPTMMLTPGCAISVVFLYLQHAKTGRL